eukprot:754452-Hanusia_phi.AAC.1
MPVAGAAGAAMEQPILRSVTRSVLSPLELDCRSEPARRRCGPRRSPRSRPVTASSTFTSASSSTMSWLGLRSTLAYDEDDEPDFCYCSSSCSEDMTGQMPWRRCQCLRSSPRPSLAGSSRTCRKPSKST